MAIQTNSCKGGGGKVVSERGRSQSEYRENGYTIFNDMDPSFECFQVPFEEIRPSNVAVIELNTASLRKGIKQVFEVGAHFRRLKREDQQQMTMMRNGGSPG